MRCISIVKALMFRIFSASFLITFLSPEITTSINIHVPISLSRIIMSGLLLGIVLSVYTCWFHDTVTLPHWLVSTDFGTCSYQCFMSNCTPASLLLLLLHSKRTIYPFCRKLHRFQTRVQFRLYCACRAMNRLLARHTTGKWNSWRSAPESSPLTHKYI